MTKYLSIFTVLIVLNGSAYADPENDQSQSIPSDQFSSTPTRVGGDSFATPVPTVAPVPTATPVVMPQPSDKWGTAKPLILSILSLLIGLLSLFMAFRFRGQSKRELEQSEQKMERNVSLISNKLTEKKVSHHMDQKNGRSLNVKGINSDILNGEERIESLEHTVEELKKTLKQVLTKLSEIQNELMASKERNALVANFDTIITSKAKHASIPTLVAEVNRQSDEDILDLISDRLQPLLQLPQEGNIPPVEAEFQSDPLQSLVKSFLSLKTSLHSASTRYYDVLALVLKQPLANGANTLVYLRTDIGQHSNLSAIFEGVPDGARIKETVNPAQLKQNGEQVLDFSEQNIVQKGTVNLG